MAACLPFLVRQCTQKAFAFKMIRDPAVLCDSTWESTVAGIVSSPSHPSHCEQLYRGCLQIGLGQNKKAALAIASRDVWLPPHPALLLQGRAVGYEHGLAITRTPELALGR